VVAVARKWASAATTPIVFKRATDATASVGWNIYTLADGTSAFKLSDGTNVPTASTAYTAGQLLVLAGIRDVTADTVASTVNGTTTSTSDSTTGTLANGDPLRIGRYSNGITYGDMELVAVAVFRRALTAVEVATITSYYQTRLS
jgi:hypothetical protein